MFSIQSVRLGFATNSSSTHSLLLLRKGGKLADVDVEAQDFGWSHFTAASRQAKGAYLAQLIRHAMRKLVNDETAIMIARSLTGITASSDGYIDHQSAFELPFSRDGQGLDLVFLKEFSAFLLRQDLAIFGGNDNDDVSHPSIGEGAVVDLAVPRDSRPGRLIARKDSRGYWVIFNVVTGTKVRFAWEPMEVGKADAPELVDLKITSYCPHDCPYCYQGSTGTGVHASEESLRKILCALREMEIFEVAIGGGEPTAHPMFWDLLRDVRRLYEMVPNFSTRNIDWLHVPEKAAIVRDVCGGFAVSCSKPAEVDAVVLACRTARMPLDKLSIQHVVGSEYEGSLDILDRCSEHDLRCTLLGYKPVGRGTKWKPKKDDWIVSLKRYVEKVGWIGSKVGIDTVLASSSEKELKELDVEPHSYETKDGRFSMYADAVEATIGPSSYGGERMKLPLDDSEFAPFMKKHFARW
jgi:hypothetical protein